MPRWFNRSTGLLLSCARAVALSQNPAGMQAIANTFQITSAATLAETREATLAVRQFLAGRGLSEEELFACELALVEACNNAVHHATPEQRQQPIAITANCTDSAIELTVEDHTSGFDLADRIEQPEPEVERGRGLFLIESMVDEMTYHRGTERNVLLLRRRRQPLRASHAP